MKKHRSINLYDKEIYLHSILCYPGVTLNIQMAMLNDKHQIEIET